MWKGPKLCKKVKIHVIKLQFFGFLFLNSLDHFFKNSTIVEILVTQAELFWRNHPCRQKDFGGFFEFWWVPENFNNFSSILARKRLLKGKSAVKMGEGGVQFGLSSYIFFSIISIAIFRLTFLILNHKKIGEVSTFYYIAFKAIFWERLRNLENGAKWCIFSTLLSKLFLKKTAILLLILQHTISRK